MGDIKTNIDKIVDELDFYMRQYPNTYSEVKHLLFEIEEQEQKIRKKAIDDFYDKALNFEDYIEPINEDNGVLVYSGKDITNMIVTIAKEMKGGAE